MPSRTEESASTSMPLNLTPRWLRICTTVAENPHCGKTGVPFMNSTTGGAGHLLAMRSCTGDVHRLILLAFLSPLLGCARLQRERVKFVAHPAAQRLIDHLVLLHPALAA
jgi:hypothetical protein